MAEARVPQPAQQPVLIVDNDLAICNLIRTVTVDGPPMRRPRCLRWALARLQAMQEGGASGVRGCSEVARFSLRGTASQLAT
jgi:hypothetical protein